MPGKDAITRLEQLLHRRKPRTVEAPVGMFDQFLVTLVGSIDGMKESLRISRVNGHRNPQSPTFFPDGIDTRIVHSDKLARLVTRTQSKIFQNFQTSRATRNCIADLLHHL